ncbi:DEAD-box ATP-dependent RNA helicase 52-like [Arachis stenosperma]|uniref:DEAD-box ATP-dependent RNA helicase 52-like n=1 Tax=Arachis stenosperma TaxID=217475 RepID=UPI0025AD2BD7|nr:DEAD-box ATP-dependent RNA helicase 52-like [Arachis stenosperma]
MERRRNPTSYPQNNAFSSYPFSDNAYSTSSAPAPRGKGRAGYSTAPSGARERGRRSSCQQHEPSSNWNNRFPIHISQDFNHLDLNAEDDTTSGAGGGINFDAYESVPVEVSGDEVPLPVESFVETDFHQVLKTNIERCKYVKPTPIQRHAIPIASAGRDLMACAQTGSGKTAAFCFPIISVILKNRRPGFTSVVRDRGGTVSYPTALILSPTRELSCQIHDEAKKFAHQTGVKVVVAYGGAAITQQLRNLEKGVDILVATPGRLVDIIERGRVSLTRIKILALDEADRMLDMGFEQQIRKIVEQMDMPPPGVRQTMLFSATFPDDIQKLASDFLSNYIFLSVGRVGSSTELIVQKVEYVEDNEKINHLVDLLHGQNARGANGKPALTLVFVETKRGADILESTLTRKGFRAIAIHGDKVQMERERALRSFKKGATPIMVATDVASRGLDIPHVAHVINYDLPRNIDDYVHRIGRTGRAGKSGFATAFFSYKNNHLAKPLVDLLQEAKQEIPSWLSQYAGESSPYDGTGGSHPSQQYGGRDFRNVTEPEVENYDNHSTTFGDSYNADYTFDIKDSNEYADSSSYEMANSVPPATSCHYTYANTDLYGGGNVEDGPGGYASIVATGWD